MSGNIWSASTALNSADQEHQLLQAAFHGSLELVKSLVTKDNLNARDAIGRTPLALACWGDHYSVAEHLLEAGADITGQFRQVSTLKHAKIVELLLKFGADVNEQYPDGQRPLHHACERDNMEVVKVLLKYGADVNAKDSYGKAALHYACSRGSLPLASLLSEHHADLNVIDNHSRTPLYSACRHFPIARLLLENGANVSPFDRYGRSLLDTSSLRSDVLALLLDYGCGADSLCHCGCERTVLLCQYINQRARDIVNADYERYSIKSREANFPNLPELLDTDWTERDAYRSKCLAELARLKSEFIDGSTVNYYSILSRDLSCVKRHPFMRLTPERCRQFPIYGNMIYSSYLKIVDEFRRIQRVLLMERSVTLFYSTSLPWLPPECVSIVLSYLSLEDLSNCATLCNI